MRKPPEPSKVRSVYEEKEFNCDFDESEKGLHGRLKTEMLSAKSGFDFT